MPNPTPADTIELPPVWADATNPYLFVVQTATRDHLRFGRLVNLSDGTVGEEKPFAALAESMPHSNFRLFDGDFATAARVRDLAAKVPPPTPAPDFG